MGRSDLTNFLEQGQELAFAPTTANFLDSKKQYSQLVVSYKRTFVFGNANIAAFASSGAMTRAAIPYLFHLGGYDTVRGFSTNRAIGRYYLTEITEYRPYLGRFPLPIAGTTVLQGCVFEDVGAMFNSDDLSATRRVDSEVTLASAGIGVRFNFLRFAGAIVRIDVARTIHPDEGVGVGLGVGQFF